MPRSLTNISREQYEQAKRIVSEFENNQLMTIAVASFSVEDFRRWVKDRGYGSDFKTKMAYFGDRDYVCVVNPQDCRGYRFDAIELTERFWENKYTKDTLAMLQLSLKSQVKK